MRAVFARATTTVALPNGSVVAVMEGSHWSDEDPLVLAHPDLFSDDPRHGMLFSHPLGPGDYPGADEAVETATAAPGEKRAAVRRDRG